MAEEMEARETGERGRESFVSYEYCVRGEVGAGGEAVKRCMEGEDGEYAGGEGVRRSMRGKVG